MKDKGSAASRLEALGLDVEFLAWLEGEEERLPRIENVRKLGGAKLAAAVRGAVWMTSQLSNPQIVEASGAVQWKKRYQQVEAFLWNVLRYSMVANRLKRPDDIQALEETLELLLPPQQVGSYRRDIQRLRKLGKPERLQDTRVQSAKRKRGGPQSREDTQRMRAAVEYIRTKSDEPYRDLADLWNQRLDGVKYGPEDIRQRLRKGEQAGPELLEFWRRIFRGEGWVAFPGEWPQGES